MKNKWVSERGMRVKANSSALHTVQIASIGEYAYATGKYLRMVLFFSFSSLVDVDDVG